MQVPRPQDTKTLAHRSPRLLDPGVRAGQRQVRSRVPSGRGPSTTESGRGKD